MTIMMRSALVAWGRQNIPPELHSIVDGKMRTWEDVMRDRRERQAEILRRKRHVTPPRPFKLWVAYFDQSLMGGWHAFLETYGPPTWDQRIWIDRDYRAMMPVLLREFPLVLPFGSEREQWEAWKPLFAKHYQRGMQDGKPRGSIPVWWSRYQDGITPIVKKGKSLATPK